MQSMDVKAIGRAGGGGEGREVPIPIASDATKWEIPTLLPRNTMGMGRPVS